MGVAVDLPKSYKFKRRGLFGTNEIRLARGDRALIPADMFLGVTRGIDGTTAAAHLAGTKFPIFAGRNLVEAAIAHTFAHEATHTLQQIGIPNEGHLRGQPSRDRVAEEFRFLMDAGQVKGSWPTNGIATTHSPKTLEKLVLK